MNTTTINALARKYKLAFDDVRGVITRLGAEPMGVGSLGKNTIAFYDVAAVEPVVAEYAAEKFRKRAERKAQKLAKAQKPAKTSVVDAGVDTRLDALFQAVDTLSVAVTRLHEKLDRIESSSVVSMEAFQP